MHHGTLEVDPNSARRNLARVPQGHIRIGGTRRRSAFSRVERQDIRSSATKESRDRSRRGASRKVRFLAEQGFELCGHTLWHANLGKYSDAVVQEQIARGTLAIDSAVPGYRVRTFALPLGVWPKNRALAVAGEWKNPRGGKIARYDFDAVLEVAGGPARSPYDPAFDPKRLTRIEVFGNQLERTLDQLDQSGGRYVSDGESGHGRASGHAERGVGASGALSGARQPGGGIAPAVEPSTDQ